MTSKEIKEIRKRYTKEHCSVARLCGCYVNGEKEKLASFAGSLLTMHDEELFKYIEILKKCLSGSPEKTLFDLEIPLGFELGDETYKLLMGMRESGLKNEELMDLFYDRVIEHFDHAGNYLILVAIDTYDVPGQSKLGDRMDDASEESFTYMICAICPVELGKPGLKFSSDEGWFMAIDRDWIAETPVTGFMFPAFNDRSTDIHSALWYAKTVEFMQYGLLEALFGAKAPLTAAEKKEAFGTVVNEIYQDACTAEAVKAVHETLVEEAEMIQNEPDLDTSLSKNRVRSILEKSGASDEQMRRFDSSYEEAYGDDTGLDINTICSRRYFTVKVKDLDNTLADLRIAAERTDLISFEEVNGRRCAVIRLEGDVEVNGIAVEP